jgi:AraC family transcriptional regulator, regulatory protein of adaptative response / methylated-DNA-[protein]-cysteine methyltransferase
MNFINGNEMNGLPAAAGNAERRTVRFAVGDSDLGAVLVAATDKGVAAILLGDDRVDVTRVLRARLPEARLIGDDDAVAPIMAQVLAFIETPTQGLELPLDPCGTAFERRVWQALREIPVGARVSYGAIARRIGEPAAAREVGEACAANPIALAIPCHRVVRKDGGLSGYRWGVARKRALLEREAKA